MADVDRIIEELLKSRRISEGAAFSTHTFSDQPIIERGSSLKARMEQREAVRAARRQHKAQERQEARRRPEAAPRPPQADAAPHPPLQRPIDFGNRAATPEQQRIGRLPKALAEMRRLEKGGVHRSLAYGSRASSELFLRQARLMEDYEDDFEFSGDFFEYYPTYAAMSNRQLRGYFAWRTRVRAGQVERAPLSFAFVYVYELLAGIGTTPGAQGLADLRAFATAYGSVATYDAIRLRKYLNRWLLDYAVYHNVADALPELASGSQGVLSSSVVRLMRAEHAQLARIGKEARVPSMAPKSGEVPTPTELLDALSGAATYHLNESRLAKSEPELVALVAQDVFEAQVAHCASRRKTDYVEGLFGYGYGAPYTMFAGAVFYEDKPHEDCIVTINDVESFSCSYGVWRHTLVVSAHDRSKELGTTLHAIDYELRRQLDFAYPLKQRKVPPKYVQRMVQKSIESRLAERAEAERRRITIDLSQLGHIRAAAAVTQEALLTDEERGLEDAVPMPAPPQATPTPAVPPKPARDPAGKPAAAQPGTPGPLPAEPDAQGPLSPVEARVLRGLLEGRSATELLSASDPFVSVIVDSINEKLFDTVGDTVIEFDGTEPQLVEDYLEDIREVL